MITLQNADAALKDYYLDAFTAELNENVSPFFSAIEKNTEGVSGKDVKLTIVRRNAGGIVAGSEDGDLPGPYKNRYINITMPLKNIYGTIEISDKAMRASRESAGAFVNLVNAEMEGLISSAKDNFRRMLFCDGTGYLCRIKRKVSANSYEVDYPRPYFVGMQVDVYVGSKEVANCNGIFITALERENNIITFSADITENIEEGQIYVHGSKNTELSGIDAVFGRRSLYGADKENDPYFIPYHLDTDGTLSVQKLCDILDYMEEARNSKINMILCSYKTRKMIAALADDSKRIVNTIDINTGYGAITVSNVPVYADRFCHDNKIYFLNTEDFALYQLCDWEWLEDEDGKILKQIPGKAAYSATLVKYAELICRKPCGQAILMDFDADYFF